MPNAEPLILYEQGPCLVVWKPPGLLTQAPPGIESLEGWVKAFLKGREQKLGRVYLGVPHRLDRPASGAILLARHQRATRRLTEQFEARSIRKLYWVCVEGHVDPPAGTWADYLRKVPGEARAEVVPADHPEARYAVLHYRTLWQAPWGSWLEVELGTGRTHQIRIQAASRGHPVLGDHQYGATCPFGHPYADHRLRAIALHARQLDFHHPMTHQPVCVTAPVTEDWHALGMPIEKLGPAGL